MASKLQARELSRPESKTVAGRTRYANINSQEAEEMGSTRDAKLYLKGQAREPPSNAREEAALKATNEHLYRKEAEIRERRERRERRQQCAQEAAAHNQQEEPIDAMRSLNVGGSASTRVSPPQETTPYAATPPGHAVPQPPLPPPPPADSILATYDLPPRDLHSYREEVLAERREKEARLPEWVKELSRQSADQNECYPFWRSVYVSRFFTAQHKHPGSLAMYVWKRDITGMLGPVQREVWEFVKTRIAEPAQQGCGGFWFGGYCQRGDQ